MAKTRIYEIDGMEIEIPLKWDNMSKKYLENYDDLIENPKQTPLGYPIVTITQDACLLAPEGVTDCWSCPHYKPAGKRKTWFGSCRNELNKREQKGGEL